MTNQEEHMDFEEMCKQSEKSHRRGKVIGGIFVVLAGSLFLARELGAEIPSWVFTWKAFLIALGLIIGVKHNFRHAGWFFLIAIGLVFLLGDIYPLMNIRPFLWPVLIIFFGLVIIFKPRRKFKHRHWGKFHDRRNRFNNRHSECFTSETTSENDLIDFTTFMGSVKKNILSKNFKGGEITNVFGGSEINLSQADIEKTATLELTNVFGGTRLIIPANWEVHSELVSVFGNIEDKRPIHPGLNSDVAKVLILKGTTFMGGIEIKSY
jgi:predicted membrane protein